MHNVRHMPHAQAADNDGLSSNRAPHDAEAEALVIGAIMHSADAYNACAQIIDRGDIYLPAHRLIWDTVAGLVAANTPPHPVLVRAEIEKQGLLHKVDGGNLINQLGADYLPAANAPHFAEQIYETARARRYDEHANQLKAAVVRGAAGDELNALVADFNQAEQLRESTGRGPAHLVAALLNWGTFFATDFGSVQLLPGRLMGPGQQITVVGDGKAGKSLFVQEWMWRMATGQTFLGDKPQPPVRILYLDAENGQEQVQERFLSFGAGPLSMGELRYASFPPIRPLDTAGGGADLLALVKATTAELVVIDTVSRFISGPENDADTWLGFYRHTLLPLKRDRVSSVRLDHFGKDKDRGGRGSSAKTQDVDHVWELSAQGGGALTLKRTHTRTGIGPDHFALQRQAARDGDNWAVGGTRHVLMVHEPATGPAAIPGTVEHVVNVLDRAGIPNDASNRTVRLALAELQVPAGNSKIADAVAIRKGRPETPGIDRSPEAFPDPLPDPVPGTRSRNTPGTEETAGQMVPGTPGEHPGTPPVPHVPPSKRGNGEGRPEQSKAQDPLCERCGDPLHGYRLDRGYTTCLQCHAA
ncbi:DnaB-like helicase N-terminal domain-containing protein [Streptomyces sp. NPDC047315]|uniref:AAA family ATPase n=1 Tax=Streptomyces sp. NPDC047315 TaxID=3155142 RepID=UPI0033D51913